MSEMTIIPWFGGNGIQVNSLDNTDKVVYSWAMNHEGPITVRDLLIWHNCDRNVWLKNPLINSDKVRSHKGFTPAGVGLHELVSVEPLTLSPSLYWPDCCGMHGFIQEGKWVSV